MFDKFFKTRYYDDLNVSDTWRTNTKTITETIMIKRVQE